MKLSLTILSLSMTILCNAQFYRIPIDTALTHDVASGDGGLFTWSKGISFINDSTGFRTITRFYNAPGSAWWKNQVLKTVNYGEFWDTVYVDFHVYPDDASMTVYQDILFANDTLGLICGLNMDYVLRTIDGGASWTEIPIPAYNLEQILWDDDVEHIVMFSGWLSDDQIESFDAGLTWQVAPESYDFDGDFYGPCQAVSLNFEVISQRISCIEDDYQILEFPLTEVNGVMRQVNTIAGTSENHWTVGSSGIIGVQNFVTLATTWDGGETYEHIDFPHLAAPGDILYVDNVTAYAVGFSPVEGYSPEVDVVWKTIDGGHTWYTQEMIPHLVPFVDDEGIEDYAIPDLFEVECPSPQVCYLYGPNNLYRSLNAGGPLMPAQGIDVNSVEKLVMTDIHLFPNPASTTVSIQGLSAPCSITIRDVSGRTVYQGQVHTVDVRSFPQGLYTVDLLQGSYHMVKKLVVE